MNRTGKATAAVRNPARGETAFQEFANGNYTPEQLRQQAASLLDSKELLQNVRGLTPEDQTRFVDKVDRVCQDALTLSRNPSLTVCKGISDCQPAKCEIRNRFRQRV